MNYYEKHIGDYLKKTIGLSMLEDGAYNRLMDYCYQSEHPLPLDRKEVYKLARATKAAEKKAVDTILEKFFKKTEQGFVQNRIQEELEKYWDRDADSWGAARGAADAEDGDQVFAVPSGGGIGEGGVHQRAELAGVE